MLTQTLQMFASFLDAGSIWKHIEDGPDAEAASAIVRRSLASIDDQHVAWLRSKYPVTALLAAGTDAHEALPILKTYLESHFPEQWNSIPERAPRLRESLLLRLQLATEMKDALERRVHARESESEYTSSLRKLADTQWASAAPSAVFDGMPAWRFVAPESGGCRRFQFDSVEAASYERRT